MKPKKKNIELPATHATTTVPDHAMQPWEWRLLGIILLVGALLRLLYLGRCNFWQDEMGFISLANDQAGLGELARQSWGWILSIGQQPLGFMLQNSYMKFVGLFVSDIMYNPFWARLHWLLWGVAAIGGVFAMVRTLSTSMTAMIAAALFAVSFYPVFYAREVYPYAGVMAMSAWCTYAVYRHIFASSSPWRWALIAGGCALVLVYLHLNGVLYFVMLSGVIGLVWLVGYLRHRSAQRPLWVQQATRVVLCLVVVGLLVSPYVLRFVLLNKAHTQGSTYSLFSILQDPVAKFFLGERLPALVTGWLVLAVGWVSILWRRKDLSKGAVMVAITGLLAWLFIGLSTSRSQYLSARYFAPVAPVFFWWFAEGIQGLARLIRKESLARIVAVALLAVYAAIHLVLYLPGLYALRDKDVGFGKIATWLNENLEPGTPYLMESAYELRWVSGYHPTPGLIGAAPYVHGGAPGELERLHQRQIEFMQRFPEAPFVESAHHNADTREGVWLWPKQFHTRHVQLRNDPLRKLVTQGIFPGVPKESVTEFSYNTDIYFSPWEDILTREKNQGTPVFFHYPNWSVVQVAQGEYRRAMAGTTGHVTLQRLRDEPLNGKLQLSGIVFGQSQGEVNLTITLEGQEPIRRRQGIGQNWRIDVPVDQRNEHNTRLNFHISSAAPIQGLVLDNIQFIPLPTNNH